MMTTGFEPDQTQVDHSLAAQVSGVLLSLFCQIGASDEDHSVIVGGLHGHSAIVSVHEQLVPGGGQVIAPLFVLVSDF